MTCMLGIIVVRLQSLQERQASRHNAAGDHRNLVEMAEQEVLYCPTRVRVEPVSSRVLTSGQGHGEVPA